MKPSSRDNKWRPAATPKDLHGKWKRFSMIAVSSTHPPGSTSTMPNRAVGSAHPRERTEVSAVRPERLSGEKQSGW
jgi:hypothetical protein